MEKQIDRKNRDRKGGHDCTPLMNKLIKRQGIKKIRRQFKEAKVIADALLEMHDEYLEEERRWDDLDDDYYQDYAYDWEDYLDPEPEDELCFLDDSYLGDWDSIPW